MKFFGAPLERFAALPHFRKGRVDLLRRTKCGIVSAIQSARGKIMSKNNKETWNTKYGKRRVREENAHLG